MAAQPNGTAKSETKSSQRPSNAKGADLFKFINSFSPEDSKSSSHRKAVRSQAARPRHARGSFNSSEDSRIRRKYARSKRNVTFKIQLSLEGDGTQRECKIERSTDEADDDDDPFDELTPVSPTMNGGWVEPFGYLSASTKTYPFAPGIIRHYLDVLAVPIPELDAGCTGLLRSRWFPMALTDPALFQVILLTSASHYATTRQTTKCASQLLHMRHEAIMMINELLRDPEKSLTDQAIAAVAKMASYEAMFGDRNAYEVHMKGLIHMVKLRGGLSKLGLDGLLARMLLWIDNNAAFIMKSRLYIASSVTQPGQPLAPPNPSMFLGAS